jgi:hypothetical protein
MDDIERRLSRYQLLIEQLNIIVLFEEDLGLSKKERENAINIILDEMIDIKQFFKDITLENDDLN